MWFDDLELVKEKSSEGSFIIYVLEVCSWCKLQHQSQKDFIVADATAYSHHLLQPAVSLPVASSAFPKGGLCPRQNA